MNGTRWSKLLEYLLLVVMAAVFFAKIRGYIGLERDTIILMLGAAGVTLAAVRARRGEFVLPAGFRTMRVSKLVWTGVGLVLGSFAALFCSFALFDASYWTLVPFVILLPAGLFMLAAAVFYKLLQATWGK